MLFANYTPHNVRCLVCVSLFILSDSPPLLLTQHKRAVHRKKYDLCVRRVLTTTPI